MICYIYDQAPLPDIQAWMLMSCLNHIYLSSGVHLPLPLSQIKSKCSLPASTVSTTVQSLVCHLDSGYSSLNTHLQLPPCWLKPKQSFLFSTVSIQAWSLISHFDHLSLYVNVSASTQSLAPPGHNHSFFAPIIHSQALVLASQPYCVHSAQLLICPLWYYNLSMATLSHLDFVLVEVVHCFPEPCPQESTTTYWCTRGDNMPSGQVHGSDRSSLLLLKLADEGWWAQQEVAREGKGDWQCSHGTSGLTMVGWLSCMLPWYAPTVSFQAWLLAS